MRRDDDAVGRDIWCIYTETNSDDDDCPDDKPKCPEPDCEGNYLGLCTKEPIINCPCDMCLKVEDVFCEDDHDFYFDLDTIAQLANASCPLKSPGARRTGPDAPDNNYYTPGSVESAIEYFGNKYANKDDEVRISDLFLVATPQDDYPEHRVPTWISARNWTDHPDRHECDKTNLMANHTLQASECNLALKQANFACSGQGKPRLFE
ncbi:hypothetical protein QC764_205795 [Podospora pseudoanserina]|uniref:C-type lectin domain-containing protein n=1 Tax=Podospora pseudoanserina TaxID=2609844 RepID=A0ABR0IIG2_9PEZI|nr:hypothetical protein QC764_205795 [Podospora pseudoanserina]